MNLESYQRGLQQLIRQGKANPGDAAYLRGIEGTSRLAIVREIVCFWRAHGLERFCILTGGLLKGMGRFEQDIERFVSAEQFSPFIEEAGLQFLHFMATDHDLAVAALAKTEIALHATRADSHEEQEIEWPCNPEPILSAILNQNDLRPELFLANPYRLRVGRALPGGYACEPVSVNSAPML